MALGSSNIKISDVRNALGETTNSLKGLCQSNKINMWSKWKPIQSDVPLTNAIIKNKNSGLTIGNFNTFIECANAIKNQTALNIHTYVKPTSKYRLGDFRNYNHFKQGFVDLSFQDQYNSSGNKEARADGNFSDLVNTYSYFENNNFYVSLLVWKDDNSKYMIYTSPTQITSSSANLGMSVDHNYMLSSQNFGPGRYYYTLILNTGTNHGIGNWQILNSNITGGQIIALSNEYGITDVIASASPVPEFEVSSINGAWSSYSYFLSGFDIKIIWESNNPFTIKDAYFSEDHNKIADIPIDITGQYNSGNEFSWGVKDGENPIHIDTITGVITLTIECTGVYEDDISTFIIPFVEIG